MAKGAEFERSFCKRLSLWWTTGNRDDVFWRSSNSGGRAKWRGRKGKDTFGAHGDIAATDPVGAPLIDLLTIELKRGYNRHTVADLLDWKRPTPCEWGNWFYQVDESTAQAGSYSWMLVTRRDSRHEVVFFPWKLLMKLEEVGAFPRKYPVPLFAFTCVLKTNSMIAPVKEKIAGMRLDDFFAGVSARDIITLSKKV